MNWITRLAALGCLVTGSAFAQDECTTAVPIGEGLTSGNNFGATRSIPTGNCGGMGSDVWYRYTPLRTGTATASFCALGSSATFDTVLAAFSGSCGSLTQITCNDDFCSLLSQISFPITIGQPVFIAVGGYVARQGSFTLSVRALGTAAAPDVVDWRRPTPGSSYRGRMVYDSSMDRVIMLTPLMELWEWDGSAWRHLRSESRPPGPRTEFAFVYDAARDRLMLYGGLLGGLAARETWLWDGVRWTQRFPVTVPPFVSGSPWEMVYDEFRQRTILFGGTAAGSHTWEWDGTNWRNRFPSVQPFGREQHSMVYDRIRRRITLFGGSIGGALLNDTWEWDGNNWSQRLVALSPPPRALHAMAYDSARQRVVLFGGMQNGASADTWEWDGAAASWQRRLPATAPAVRVGHAMAYDSARQRTVLYGGDGASLEDTAEWDGTDWSVIPAGPQPSARERCAISEDTARGSVVLFGGAGAGGLLGDTWERQGARWINHTPSPSPTPRDEHAMAYDAQRGRVILFGGRTTSGASGETWEWDGSIWTLRNPAAAPLPRFAHAMAYDAGRRRVVLFGGYTGSQVLSDIWEWDGNNWQRSTPVSGPVGRVDHGMAYDPLRQRVLLFGGSATVTPAVALGDTWEWDGTNWSTGVATVPGLARWAHAMTYDSARQRVVVFGGLLAASTKSSSGTWELAGSTWIQRYPSVSPSGRFDHGLVYDAASDSTVLFGGNVARAPSNETWDYYTRSPASYAPLGSGCPGSAGTPAIAGLSGQRPWIGEVFSVQLTNLPPSQLTAMFLGFSETQFGALPLPLDLTFLGMTNCLLHIDLFAAFPVFNLTGTASWLIQIPNTPSLLGGRFFNQAFVADPGTNPFGAIMSNAAVGRIGSK